MTTVTELTDQALARAALDFGLGFPGARSPLYRRIGVRQQQLYAAAARWNPEYFGVSAVGTLIAGQADMATMGNPDLVDPTYAPEFLYRVEIADKGTSTYANGQEVAVVGLNDPSAAFPPRVTVRNQLISQVGTDLANVVSLRIYYSLRPFPVRANEGGLAVLLPEPFHELLVIDLARWLGRKADDVAPDRRTAKLQALDAEEAELLANFEQDVRAFTQGSETGRFVRAGAAPSQQ